MAMAYHDADDAGGGMWRGAVNWSAAVVSVSLVIGVAAWGFELVMRDVTGVPVVRALDGPAREAPEEPGGEQAAYQGLAVNAVAAEGEADALPDRISLAPEPLSLAEEDRAGDALARAAAERNGDGTGADAAADAIAREVARTMAALQEARRGPTEADPEADPDSGPGDAAAGSNAVTVSPRPARRPEGGLVMRAAASAESTSAGGGVEIDAATIDADALLVQVGDFSDRSGARARWAELSDAFSGAMADKQRVIEEVATAGNRFRLRVHGFEGYEAAERFCTELQAANTPCIPVRAR